MTTHARAAICRGHDHPFTIEPVELAELRPDELLVRIVACGICHTDLAVRDAQLPVPLPVVLGHEGAGIVEAVGSEVTAAAPGDRVVVLSGDTTVAYDVATVEVLSRAGLARESATIFARSGPGRLVLITCEDWDGTAYRSNVVVTARPA